MFRLAYFVLVGFLLITGFLNLDGNSWRPTQLPSFITKINEDTSVKVLPLEEWENVMPGTWNFTSSLDSDFYKGTVSYNSDKSFVRRVSCTLRVKGKNNEYQYVKAGGTVRGTWEVKDNKWFEITKECNISPVSYSVCSFFQDTVRYGKLDSDLWDYRIIYFNQDEIEINARHLSGEGKKSYKFTKEN